MPEEKEEQLLEEEIANREGVIVKTSLTGIGVNILLSAFKAVVGYLSNSIAVILDAVNNLSDALSSVITIIGTKLANRLPDREHPLGHGRAEYLSAMLVSFIVLYAGITSLIESVKKIIHPETPDYAPVSLLIIAVAVVAKILLGRYVKKQGEKVNSGALVASGSDALFDAVLSASVLASALIFVLTKVSLEAYVGAFISIFILKSGYEMITDTIDDILGKRADRELTKTIKKIINEEKEVRGAYDLLMNNYGPGKNYASVHIELPDYMTVDEVDALTRRIQAKVYKKTGTVLTGVGVYSYNTSNEEAAIIRNKVMEVVISNDFALQMHAFYLDTETKHMRFDVVMSFDIDPAEGLKILNKQMEEHFPDYVVSITPDVDLSD